MSELGRKGGEKNREKGSEYFKWIRSHRKTKNSLTTSKNNQPEDPKE